MSESTEPKLCGRCNSAVSGRILTALGKSWHPEHFVCKVCELPITGATFNEKDGDPVCSECFLQKFSEVCFGCKQPIQEQLQIVIEDGETVKVPDAVRKPTSDDATDLKKIIKALGQSWHEAHFACGGPCKKPLSGQPFFERDGQPYCKECYENIFASKCQGCGKAISDKAIIALEAKWHKDCFKCKKCQQPITANSFAVEDKLPLCTACV